MTVEEIIRGESKNAEFKEMLPNNSEKYTKTVVAYANTQGGKHKLPTVTRTNLENWKVFKKTSDGYLASNAFVLLTSDYFPFSKTVRCL